MIIEHLPEISTDDIAMPGMSGILTAQNEFHQMLNAWEDEVMPCFDVVGPFRAE